MMTTSQETCLYELPKNLRGLGLMEIGLFSMPRFSQRQSLRYATGDFYLEKMEERTMKNMWKLWLVSVLAVFMLAACGGTATEDAPAIEKEQVEEGQGTEEAEVALYPLTITDAVDNEITVEAAPTTIVSLVPSNTEVLFALGLADEVVAVTDNDDFPAEVEEKESIGGFEINIEKIISLNPEMVFAHEMVLGSSSEGLDQIRDAGIPVIVINNAANFEETYATIEMMGQVTDKVDEANQIIEDLKAKVADITEKLETVEEEKTLFVETSPAPEIYTPGNATFMQEMLDLVGAENIAADQEGWVMMDPEEIVKRNPDVIIVMYDYIETAVEDVYARDGFDTITAIKEEQVIQVDENITSRTGPRLADGLEAIAKAIYPEVFGE